MNYTRITSYIVFCFLIFLIPSCSAFYEKNKEMNEISCLSCDSLSEDKRALLHEIQFNSDTTALKEYLEKFGSREYCKEKYGDCKNVVLINVLRNVELNENLRIILSNEDLDQATINSLFYSCLTIYPEISKKLISKNATIGLDNNCIPFLEHQYSILDSIGYNYDSQDSDGNTSFLNLCKCVPEYSDDPDIIVGRLKKLIDRNVNIHHKNKEGKGALDLVKDKKVKAFLDSLFSN